MIRTKAQPISKNQRQKLVERLDQVILAELIEERFAGPFISTADAIKEIRRHKRT